LTNSSTTQALNHTLLAGTPPHHLSFNMPDPCASNRDITVDHAHHASTDVAPIKR